MKSILEGFITLVVMALVGLASLLGIVLVIALQILLYGGALAVAAWIVFTVYKVVVG